MSKANQPLTFHISPSLQRRLSAPLRARPQGEEQEQDPEQEQEREVPAPPININPGPYREDDDVLPEVPTFVPQPIRINPGPPRYEPSVPDPDLQ